MVIKNEFTKKYDEKKCKKSKRGGEYKQSTKTKKKKRIRTRSTLTITTTIMDGMIVVVATKVMLLTMCVGGVVTCSIILRS